MRSCTRILFLLGFALSAGAAKTDAQMGPIIDWITKLSGPGVIRFGPQYTLALGDRSTPEVSFAGLVGFKSRDGDAPDGSADLNMLSGQATLDLPVIRLSPTVHLLAIGGVAGHLFLGDDFDDFTTFSFPLQGAVRVRTRAVTLRLGLGINVFRFPGDAFSPLDVGVDRSSWEAAFGTQAALLFKL